MECSRIDPLTVILLVIMTVSILTAGCATTSPEVVTQPVIRTEKAVLVWHIDERGEQFVLGEATNQFSTNDQEIISFIKLRNVTGVHNLRWEWYDPKGTLYDVSQDYPVVVSRGKYVDSISAWHKISVKGEKAQNLPGKWKVNVYLDNQRIAANAFDLGTAATAATAGLADVDVNILQTRIRNPDGVAVVIGNRYYKSPEIPEVKYADNDARVVKEYLVKTLGYKETNIIFKLDATKAEFEQIFGIKGNPEGRLNEYIKPGKSDVFIYYSGHGAPDPNTRKGYFIPSDCDSSRYSLNGYPLDVFYENVSKLEAKSITIVLDACFSGATNSGKSLVSNASPFGIRVDNPTVAKGNTVCLTSSEGDQISSWYDDKRHGLFTYFFLKGLGGVADKDGNNKLTYEELYAYISDNTEGVPYWARRLHEGRKQTPTIQGVYANKIILEY